MRKLKLQVQTTVDGFMGGPNGEMDWMTLPWTDDMSAYVDALTKPVDLIVLGRRLADGFIPAWASRPPGEDEAFLFPDDSGQRASVYEHCCRSIDRSLTRGAHGLPLMGTGDWNDGMNRVGHQGKGESVWLGWFLYTTLMAFVPHVDERKQKMRGNRYRKHLENLRKALEEKGWDGDWYRRAGVLFDPHTADGVAIAQHHRDPGVPMICLETALPAKFAAAIEAAIGMSPLIPAALADLPTRVQRYTVMPNDVGLLKRHIASATAVG